MGRGSTSFRNPNCMAANLLFYIPYASTLVLYLVLYRTLFSPPFQAEPLFDLCQIASVMMLGARESLFCRWDKRTVALFAIVCLICVNGYIAHWTALAGTCLFAFCARNLNLKRLMAVSVALIAVVMTVTIASSLVGIIPNIDATQYHEGNPLSRYTLGFKHPNTVGILTFGIISSVVSIREERMRMHDLVAMLALLLVVFSATMSRTMAMCGILLLILAPVAAKLSGRLARSKPFMWAVALFVPALSMATLALVVFYDQDVQWMHAINTLLSNRLLYGHAAWQHCDITLWGHSVSFPTNERLTLEGDAFVWRENRVPVDCFYAASVLHSGVVSTVAFIALYALACVNTLRTSRVVLTAVLLVIAIYAVCENGAMHFYYVPAVMYLTAAFRASCTQSNAEPPCSSSHADDTSA